MPLSSARTDLAPPARDTRAEFRGRGSEDGVTGGKLRPGAIELVWRGPFSTHRRSRDFRFWVWPWHPAARIAFPASFGGRNAVDNRVNPRNGKNRTLRAETMGGQKPLVVNPSKTRRFQAILAWPEEWPKSLVFGHARSRGEDARPAFTASSV